MSATCGAKTRAGTPCRKTAGWNTPHLGRGRCALHGGNSPNHLARDELERAREAAATLGLPREIDPYTALQEELERCAGAVAWLGDEVRKLTQEQMVFGVDRVIRHPDGAQTTTARARIHSLLRLYRLERDRLVRIAALSVEIGLAERQLALNEQHAPRIAQIITATLADLGLDPAADRVRQAVRFRLLEGGGDDR